MIVQSTRDSFCNHTDKVKPELIRIINKIIEPQLDQSVTYLEKVIKS